MEENSNGNNPMPEEIAETTTETPVVQEDSNQPHWIKPYGDRMDDGMVQLSFTLPTKSGPEAREAAIQLAQKMGFEKVLVAHMESITDYFTYFVVYGKTTHSVDISQIHVTKLENPLLDFDQINDFIGSKIGRKLVVVGACIGSDAHTVGIDAIFNMKGFAHDWGFERYAWMEAHNLRAQVAASDLIDKLVELKADAVLISRVVTQRDEHITELKNFLELLKTREGLQPHLITICGGPRLNHQVAIDLGYDAGFGSGTKPSEVGSFIVHEFHKRCPELYIPPLPVKPEPQAEVPEEIQSEIQASETDPLIEPVEFNKSDVRPVDSAETTENEPTPQNSETAPGPNTSDTTTPSTNKPRQGRGRSKQRHPWRRRGGGRTRDDASAATGETPKPRSNQRSRGNRQPRPPAAGNSNPAPTQSGNGGGNNNDGENKE